MHDDVLSIFSTSFLTPGTGATVILLNQWLKDLKKKESSYLVLCLQRILSLAYRNSTSSPCDIIKELDFQSDLF